MKAIILAAGSGSRLYPLTKNRPKCLVEYKGRAILDWILSALKTNEISDITIVKGYLPESIKVPGTKEYINSRYFETNMVYTLFCAYEQLTTDSLISYADIIYPPKALESLINSGADIAVLIDRNWRELWQKRMANPLDDAETLKLNQHEEIIEIGKKPISYDDIQGQYMGLIKVSASAWPKIIDFYSSLDKTANYDGKSFENMYMTTFLQLIIDRLMPIQAVLTDTAWLEIDCIEDLNCDIEIN